MFSTKEEFKLVVLRTGSDERDLSSIQEIIPKRYVHPPAQAVQVATGRSAGPPEESGPNPPPSAGL